jgi:hypothetical protein
MSSLVKKLFETFFPVTGFIISYYTEIAEMKRKIFKNLRVFYYFGKNVQYACKTAPPWPGEAVICAHLNDIC